MPGSTQTRFVRQRPARPVSVVVVRWLSKVPRLDAISVQGGGVVGTTSISSYAWLDGAAAEAAERRAHSSGIT